MGSATLISVAEYLSTAYRADRDYVEGVVAEWGPGDGDHRSKRIFLSEMFSEL